MNIIVDLLFIVPGKNRGTQTYVDSLLTALYDAADTNIMCLTNRSNHGYYNDSLGFQCHLTPVDGRNRLTRGIYQQTIMSFTARSAGGDVLFCPGYLSPIFSVLPTVVVLHDVNFRDIPKLVPSAVQWAYNRRWAYNMIVPLAVRSASRVITASQFSKERIIAELDLPDDKVVVIHEGPLLNPGHTAENMWPAIKQKYSITGECFLSISSGLPQKNLNRLVHGFIEMKKKSRGHWQLALVGCELDDEIEAYLEREGYREDVVATGFVSDSEKAAFLNNSTAYVFPSLYEGFGLPALEAQSFGLPLAASRFGSLPEICGDGAIYFDALSIESIADTMLELSESEELRDNLIQAGYENVTRFSWQSAAKETLSVLRSAVPVR